MGAQIVPVTNDILRRQSLEATRIFSCRRCGAPGVYKSHESIHAGWPGCYVEAGDPRDTQSVGDYCPNCGVRRGEDKHLGEIWSREWRYERPNRLFEWARNLFQ